jgi:Tfp pilus assembly protein PilV
MFIKRSIKVFVIAIVAFAFASVGTAFAAQNTVDASKAGDGNAAISGYTVTGIHYTLNADPTKLETVSFDLGAVATDVHAGLGTGSSPFTYTYYSCSNTSGTIWSCSIAGARTVLEVMSLRVIATE